LSSLDPSADARECGVCWWLYDTTHGDPDRGIPRGTPFDALDDAWTCPKCEAPRFKFLPRDARRADGTAAPGAADATPIAATTAAADLPRPTTAPALDPPERRLGALLDRLTHTSAALAQLDVYNPRLGVEATPLVPLADGHVGVVVTPWFMSLVWLPARPEDVRARPGETHARAFASGLYDFVAAEHDTVGPYETCSLFSPMFEFAAAREARAVADAALAQILAPEPAAPPAPPAAAPPMTRRALFGALRREEGGHVDALEP
jgi:[NiFe] hydrogenase assembly HybE family chaperone